MGGAYGVERQTHMLNDVLGVTRVGPSGAHDAPQDRQDFRQEGAVARAITRLRERHQIAPTTILARLLVAVIAHQWRRLIPA